MRVGPTGCFKLPQGGDRDCWSLSSAEAGVFCSRDGRSRGAQWLVGLGKEPDCKVIDFGSRVQRVLIAFDVAVNEEKDEVIFVYRRHDVERVAAVFSDLPVADVIRAAPHRHLLLPAGEPRLSTVSWFSSVPGMDWRFSLKACRSTRGSSMGRKVRSTPSSLKRTQEGTVRARSSSVLSPLWWPHFNSVQRIAIKKIGLQVLRTIAEWSTVEVIHYPMCSF